ncbi:MAG: aspartate/glutamate racemase family protein [Proteobacteria bacterium]|nr:aspartate/glutamate racemase family protein [Pseudomonadota bacterium]
MKTIGLLGGMSYESSIEYYRMINKRVNQKLGDTHSSKCILFSLDFWEIQKHIIRKDWDTAKGLLINGAKVLERGGAELLILCANTAHKFADDVQEEIKIPLIHIADKTAEKISEAGIKKVALLGTRVTMEESFYRDRLKEKYNIDVITPGESDRQLMQDIIFNELCVGIIKDAAKDKFRAIIKSMYKQGAEGIILGCTEIPLLIKQEDSPVPTFDTTRIHAEAAADYALN